MICILGTSPRLIKTKITLERIDPNLTWKNFTINVILKILVVYKTWFILRFNIKKNFFTRLHIHEVKVAVHNPSKNV